LLNVNKESIFATQKLNKKREAFVKSKVKISGDVNYLFSSKNNVCEFLTNFKRLVLKLPKSLVFSCNF